MTGNEATHAQYLPLPWPVRQSGAASEHNDVILTNLMTSHCFNPIPQLISSLDWAIKYATFEGNYFMMLFKGQNQGSNKLRNRIDVCDVIRFVSMTSLGSIAAPDCRTGQNKGRYRARARFNPIPQSISSLSDIIDETDFSTLCICFP